MARAEARTVAAEEPGALWRGAAGAFALKVAGAGVGFVLQLVLARSLGTEGFGGYALGLAWGSVAVLAGKVGLDAAALRFVPEYAGEPGRLAGFLAWSRRRVAVGSALAAALGAAATLALGDALSPATRGALLGGFAGAPLLAFLQLEAGVLQATKRVVASQGPLLVGVPLVAVLLVVLLFGGLGVPATPGVALLAYGAAGGVAWAAAARARRRLVPLGPASPAADAERAEWRSVARAMLFTAGFGLVLSHADVMLLGLLSDAAETGVYNAANRLARLFAFPLLAVNAVVAPRITEHHRAMLRGGEEAEQGRAALQRLVRRSSLALSLVSLPILVVLVLGSDLLLGLFGEDFPAGRTALLVLLAGQTVNVLMGSVGYLLALTGGHAASARVLGVSAALNVLLDALLIPSLGALGAAIATAVTTAAWNLTMYAVVRRRLGIRPSFF